MRSAHSSPLSLTRLAACTLAALVLLSACGSKNAAAPGGPGGKMPKPEVGVITTRFQPVALLTELPARVEPVRVAQVRARVNGVKLAEGIRAFVADSNKLKQMIESMR